MRASDNLFLLIKSLSRSEKREFKLLAGRYRNEGSPYLVAFKIRDNS